MLRDELERNYQEEQNRKYTLDRKTNYTTLASESYVPAHSTFQPRMNTNDPSMRVPTKNTDYSADNPITYYLHEVNHSQSCGFPTTFVGSTNPFRKCTHFSNDIRHSIGKQAETHERPKQLPTSGDYTVLQGLKNRLLLQPKSIIPGATVALILDNLYTLEVSTNGKCSLEELQNSFMSSSLLIEFNNEEKMALLRTFDLDNDKCVFLTELTHFFRPFLSARRYELVEMAFSTCDQSGVGFLTENDLKAHFSKKGFYNYVGNSVISSADQASLFFFQSIQDYLGSNGTVDLGDFVEYYSCVSAEVLSDAKFEELLVCQWNMPKIAGGCGIAL